MRTVNSMCMQRVENAYHKNYCISNGPSNEVLGNLQCMWGITCVTWEYSEHPILIFHCKYFISCHVKQRNRTCGSTWSWSSNFILLKLHYTELNILNFTCRILYKYLLPSNYPGFLVVPRIPFFVIEGLCVLFLWKGRQYTLAVVQQKRQSL